MEASPQRRPLGQSGLLLPKLTFGGNVLGWTADRATSFRLLDACLAAGINAIDTADVYSTWAPGHQGGESETVLGEWMRERGNRNKILVLTKVGMQGGISPGGLARATIERGIEGSLRRLGTDHIDLYMAHRDDQDTPLEETMEAFAGLVAAGKIGAVGASNYSGERLKAALEVSSTHHWPRFESLQTQYNLIERAEFEGSLREPCLTHNIGVMTYFSLARGFLTGKYRGAADQSKSPRGAQIGHYLHGKGIAVLQVLDRIAAELDANPAQVSLAWLMEKPGVTTAVASATHPEQLVDLIRATQLELPAWAMAQLDEVSGE